MNRIYITEHAWNDLDKLSLELQEECFLMLEKLENNIYLGQCLENKNGRDLSDCRKIYFNQAKHRIVYRIIDGQIKIEGINTTISKAEVLGIGKRDKEFIYKLISDRLGR